METSSGRWGVMRNDQKMLEMKTGCEKERNVCKTKTKTKKGWLFHASSFGKLNLFSVLVLNSDLKFMLKKKLLKY